VLADPTRRSILHSLRKGERPVNDIVLEAGIHQSGVSRHLHILLETGFVSLRPAGQHRFYSLKPERFRELDRWLAKYRTLWEVRLDHFGRALEEKQKSRKTKPREQPR
jgi:DNA-binding transcriptional ArsR family regulator